MMALRHVSLVLFKIVKIKIHIQSLCNLYIFPEKAQSLNKCQEYQSSIILYNTSKSINVIFLSNILRGGMSFELYLEHLVLSSFRVLYATILSK